MRLVEIHPDNPQARQVLQVVELLSKDGVVAYPTSSGYALGCKLSSLRGVEKIRKIRHLEEKQDFTLMCPSIAVASRYARIDNSTFTFIKSVDAGKFTFLLTATPELPKKTGSKRKTVGIRIATQQVLVSIIDELGEPLLSTSLLEPLEEDVKKGQKIHTGWSRGLNVQSFSSALDVKDALGEQIDAVVDSGDVENTPTTVVDLNGGEFAVIRQGSGVIND
ncbi:MAG: threonylcarbamoyl-AMP synthase [Candidatus Ancillula sp.]|jgi:tRNA threonylcarbamoyl adenosine modification protein (Sua5/YciO/YrdC/YwlC family)|nr:threonylcarbamoyl-AMP synthase [Candidatus Ancillula sp.]